MRYSTFDLSSPFQVSFDYQIYDDDGGLNEVYRSADGISFFFFKNVQAYQTQLPTAGSGRGFIYDGTGYGVHINIYENRYIFLENATASPNEQILDFTETINHLYTHDSWNKLTIIVTNFTIQILLNDDMWYWMR